MDYLRVVSIMFCPYVCNCSLECVLTPISSKILPCYFLFRQDYVAVVIFAELRAGLSGLHYITAQTSSILIEFPYYSIISSDTVYRQAVR